MIQIRFEGEATGLRAEALINDVPVDRDDSGAPRIVHQALNHWIVDGENELVVSLAKRRQPEPVERYECEVVARVPDGDRTSEERLSAFRWGGAPELPEEPRVVARLRFESPHKLGPWAWQDARAGEITPADRLQILGLVGEMERALRQQNLLEVLDLLKLQHQEMARAFGFAADRYRKRQESTLRAYMEHDRFRVDSVDLSKLILEPRAGGRLVFVMDRESRSPVRGAAGSVAFHLPSVFSCINGYWTLAR